MRQGADGTRTTDHLPCCRLSSAPPPCPPAGRLCATAFFWLLLGLVIRSSAWRWLASPPRFRLELASGALVRGSGGGWTTRLVRVRCTPSYWPYQPSQPSIMMTPGQVGCGRGKPRLLCRLGGPLCWDRICPWLYRLPAARTMGVSASKAYGLRLLALSVQAPLVPQLCLFTRSSSCPLSEVWANPVHG